MFAHKGNYKIGSARKKSQGNLNIYDNELWYDAYKNVWSTIKNCAEVIDY